MNVNGAHSTLSVITKDQAKADGLKKYLTSIPCANGHVCERYVSNDFCFQCSRDYHNKYKANNREKVAAIRKKWKTKNKDKHKELNKKSRLNHLDKTREKCRKYARENPLVNRAAKMRRRAKLNGSSAYIPTEYILGLKEKQKGKCMNCLNKLKEFHIDHIMPIALGGGNNKDNLQLLCPACNHSKHAKHPIDWAVENGRLL